MGRFLQIILDAKEPDFTTGIRALERATAHSNVDTRLIADITHSAHAIMRRLGLDPKDTTAQELYRTLIVSLHNGRAERLLRNADYTMLIVDGQVISFNLIDVVENAHHELPIQRQCHVHGRRALRGEIVQRYLNHARTNEIATKQIAIHAGLWIEGDDDYPGVRDTSNHNIPVQADNGPFILTIGDIVTDAFIKLREDQATVYSDENRTRRLSMEFGSKLPYDKVDIVDAVGNSANAAVAFTRLGLGAGLMAFIGDDEVGKEMLEYLGEQHVDTQTVSVQKGFKSSYHYVLKYGADRTILIKYEDYNYAWQEPARKPDWVYLSVLSNTSWQLHLDLLDYLEKNPDVKLVFQPGTFHFEWGAEKLQGIYKRAYMTVMNLEEAALVTGKKTRSVAELAQALHDLGPELVVITDGPHGAYASEGGRLLKMPNYPDPAPPYDRTGAGDAFASTIVAALAGGESLETALSWAPINSMSVVQKLGAQAGLLTRGEIEAYLSKAPSDYRIEEFKDK